jgi:hypothetical protein
MVAKKNPRRTANFAAIGKKDIKLENSLKVY